MLARTKPIITRRLDVFYRSKANWKRRAEIIDYCVKVVDEAQVGHQSDHRAGDDGGDGVVARRPSSSSSLSVGVADETKVRYNKTIGLLLLFWSDTVVPLCLTHLYLQYRQVRNELRDRKDYSTAIP